MIYYFVPCQLWYAIETIFANMHTTVHKDMVPIKHIEYWHLGDFTYLRETKPIRMMNYLFFLNHIRYLKLLIISILLNVSFWVDAGSRQHFIKIGWEKNRQGLSHETAFLSKMTNSGYGIF